MAIMLDHRYQEMLDKLENRAKLAHRCIAFRLTYGLSQSQMAKECHLRTADIENVEGMVQVIEKISRRVSSHILNRTNITVLDDHYDVDMAWKQQTEYRDPTIAAKQDAFLDAMDALDDTEHIELRGFRQDNEHSVQ